MVEAVIRPGGTGHSHGGGEVPLQTRSERVRSAVIGDHSEINRRDEQWRYIDAERLRGLDSNVLSNFVSGLSVTTPAGFVSEIVGAENN